MLLKNIILRNFRNFEEQRFVFSPFLTIIIGENAKGKTNLLEGIYFLINGVGFRESKEEELINIDKETTWVEGDFGLSDKSFNYKISLVRKEQVTVKIYLVNKTKKRHHQYLNEQTKAILFSPEQLEIINGPPEKRREYFNKQISLYDFEYKKRLVNYEMAVRKRNKILEIFKEENRLKEELFFWDRYLEEQGSYLTERRQKYVDFLNRHQNLDSKIFEIEYRKNEINQERLAEVFDLERRIRRTMIGPQKDEFIIYLNNKKKKNTHRFGSRSEQRLAVIWLKINEINYFEETRQNGRPILLLDDIFSEFDINNKKLVIDLIKKYQTIVTTTEIQLLKLANIPKTIIQL